MKETDKAELSKLSKMGEHRVFHMWSPIEQMDSVKINDSIQHEKYKHIYGIQGTRTAHVKIADNVEVTQFDWIDFSAGFVAGVTGVLFGHPLDTIKVRQQTLGPAYGSMARCVAKTFTHEGFSGFYKGLLFPLATEGCRNCLFFGVYERFKGEDNSQVDYRRTAMAGALGGAVQAIPGSPIELVKVQLQSQTGRHKKQRAFRGPVHCMSVILRKYPSQTFRGIQVTVLRDISGFAAYMTSYEYFCRVFHPEGPDFCTVYQLLLTGGSAGAISWFLNLPIDTVKSRLQSDSLSKPKYRGLFHCATSVIREEGFRALYRGLPAVLLRAFTLNAITLTAYSVCRQRFQQFFRQQEEAM